MNVERIARVAEEAAKILKDYPHLTHRQALDKAKEVVSDELSTRSQTC